MYDIDGARELVLAEWRSIHPLPTDNPGIDIPQFVESVLASGSDAFAFHCDGDHRQVIRDWITGFENARRQAIQSQGDTVATL